MKDKTIIALARLLCGTALLITTIAYHVDTGLTAVSLFLMGVPFELATKEKEERV